LESKTKLPDRVTEVENFIQQLDDIEIIIQPQKEHQELCEELASNLSLFRMLEENHFFKGAAASNCLDLIYLARTNGLIHLSEISIKKVRQYEEKINQLEKDLADLSLKEIKAEPTLSLMQCGSFLGLDTNWSLATCALQLQEVAVILVAKAKKIELNKVNVEKLLNKKIKGDFFFNDQYEAFSNEIKRLYSIDMPILTSQFRKMRVAVLHEGYNPQPEEKDSIVSFTIGLMKKLEDVMKAFLITINRKNI